MSQRKKHGNVLSHRRYDMEATFRQVAASPAFSWKLDGETMSGDAGKKFKNRIVRRPA
jgi:hypothetical protein